MPLFLDAITTNETYFFRDIQNYEWLGDTFLSEILQQALPESGPNPYGSGQQHVAPVKNRIQLHLSSWQGNPPSLDGARLSLELT